MSTEAPVRTSEERRHMTVRALDPLHLRLDAVIDAVPEARHRFTAWLRRSHVDDATRDDLGLVITELLTNAIEASAGADGSIEVRAELRDGPEVLLVVTDAGTGFELAGPPRFPAATAIRGRGLPMVDALMDALDVRRVDGRTQVIAARAVRP